MAIRMLPKGVKLDRPRVQGWRIFQKWGDTKTFVGIVIARDPQTAIETAIYRYQITEPVHQKRLTAEPRGN